MIVLTITSCPPSLSGDITKWLFEVNTGVYVGRVSARVREQLWKRVVKSARNGNATMVWSTDNEQGLDFRVHNCDWEPIDFDGLKLMMRPSLQRMSERNSTRVKLPHYLFSRRPKRKKITPKAKLDYVVVHIHGTQAAAIGVNGKKTVSEYEGDLTGLFEFVGDADIVSHCANVLQPACESAGKPNLDNRIIDTFMLAADELFDLDNHTLGAVAEYMNIPMQNEEAGVANCHVVHEIYKRLLE